MNERIMNGNDFETAKFPLKGETFARKEEIGALLARLREECRQRELGTKSVSHRSKTIMWQRWSIAAVVAVIIGFAGYTFSKVDHTTDDTQLAVTLPDNSKVQMMENSKLSYNRIEWMFHRRLSLSGKASFEVAKGKRFTVQTNAGEVSVLGTKFLIDQKDKDMHVDCFEGHVKVVNNDKKEVVLKAGESVDCSQKGLRVIEKEASEPEKELPETIEYENEPLIKIANQMEEIFSITISPKELCDGLTYTGTFYTQDREAAIEMVFSTCGLSYSVDGNNIYLKKQE